jgi:hypothetical protein
MKPAGRARGRDDMGFSSSNRCNAQIRELSEVQRTCHELVGRVDPMLLTRLGHWLCTAAMVLILGLSPIKFLV